MNNFSKFWKKTKKNIIIGIEKIKNNIEENDNSDILILKLKSFEELSQKLLEDFSNFESYFYSFSKTNYDLSTTFFEILESSENYQNLSINFLNTSIKNREEIENIAKFLNNNSLIPLKKFITKINEIQEIKTKYERNLLLKEKYLLKRDELLVIGSILEREEIQKKLTNRIEKFNFYYEKFKNLLEELNNEFLNLLLQLHENLNEIFNLFTKIFQND